MRRHRAAGALCAVLAVGTLVAAPSAARGLDPGDLRVYGGSPADGNPGVVAIAVNEGGQWVGLCSAAMWRPRLLITAAHCLTAAGTDGRVDAVAVFPPGAEVRVYSDTGPQGAATVAVRQWWKADGYVNTSRLVQPNDFAVIEPDADLAPSGFTRLATQFDLARWAKAGSQVEHVGYGLVAAKTPTRGPHSISLPLSGYRPGSLLGQIFSTDQTEAKGLCPGDSGSPVFRMEGTSAFLLGVEVGSNSACQEPPSSDLLSISAAAVGYLPVLNSALASAGYPTIPGAPQSILAVARNRTATVSWLPPVVSAEAIVGYDVLDARGVLACQATATTCTVADLRDGTHGFTVRSRNSENEGDALPVGASGRVVIAPPPRLPAPRIEESARGMPQIVFDSLVGRSSAVVIRYVVKDDKGRIVCTGLPAEPDAATLSCRLPTRPGMYRFRVTARTEMGNSRPSALSPRFRVD